MSYFKELSEETIIDVYLNGSNNPLFLEDLNNFNFLSWADQNASLSQALMTEKNALQLYGMVVQAILSSRASFY